MYILVTLRLTKRYEIRYVLHTLKKIIYLYIYIYVHMKQSREIERTKKQRTNDVLCFVFMTVVVGN